MNVNRMDFKKCYKIFLTKKPCSLGKGYILSSRKVVGFGQNVIIVITFISIWGSIGVMIVK